ncbi:MAG: putative heme-binding domain-containing protein [Rhodothermales bacterium]|jgi:putative heme-binding domain-containing protein
MRFRPQVLLSAVLALSCTAIDLPPVSVKVDRPHRRTVLLVAGTHADGTQDSLPLFAETLRAHGFVPTVMTAPLAPEFSPLGIPGLDQLERHDLVILSFRWLTLPDSQLAIFNQFLAAGKPILALRSSTRAFAYPREHPHYSLNADFGPQTLGALDSGAMKGLAKWVARPMGDHPLLAHVPRSITLHSTMIPVELAPGSTPLLMGSADTLDISREISSIPRVGRGKIISAPVAWAVTSKWNSPIIGTTLGAAADFRSPEAVHFLVNAALHLVKQPLVELAPAALDPQPPAARLQGELARALRAPALPADFATLAEQFYLRAGTQEHRALWKSLAVVPYNQAVSAISIAAYLDIFANIAAEGRLPPRPDAELRPFLNHASQKVRHAAVRLVAAGGHIGLIADSARLASDEGNSTELRFAAANALGQLSARLKQSVYIVPLMRSSQSLQTRLCGLAALAHVDSKAAAEAAIELFSRYTDDATPEHAVAAFLAVDKAATPLAQELRENPPNELISARLRQQLSLGGARFPALRDALMPPGEWTTTRKLILAQRRQAVANAMWERADPVRGEAVFRRSTSACLHCHSVAGSGPQIGPPLDRVGFMRLGDILNALLDPDKSIVDGHAGVKLVDRSGNAVRGVLSEETETHYRVRQLPSGHERLFAKSAFTKRDMPSLMSPFLIDNMSQNDFLHLVSFLRQLGMPGIYGLSDSTPTVRTWRVHTLPEGADLAAALATRDAWPSHYASAQGKLPRSELRKDLPANGRVLVSARLQVSKFGIVRLQTTGGAGIESLLANGKPVKGDVQGVEIGPLEYTWVLNPAQLDTDFSVSILPELGTDPHLDIINGP